MLRTACNHLTFFFSVPAQIIDELSSDDITVQEGDTVVLVCNVTGVPRPEVTWFRRPANSKSTEKESKMCKPRAIGPGKICCFSSVPISLILSSIIILITAFYLLFSAVYMEMQLQSLMLHICPSPVHGAV